MARQHGFALIELAIAALLATLLVVWASRFLVYRIQETDIESAALWMQSVKDATQAYLQEHGLAIKTATSSAVLQVHGFADWAVPSINEMRQAGFLNVGFPPAHRLLGQAAVLVSRQGDCPGKDCQLNTIIYGSQPLLYASGKVDEYALAQWNIVSKGQGAIVHPETPGLLRSAIAQIALPAFGQLALPAGTVARLITDEQLGADYLRVYDDRDPQFQSNLSAKGSIQADENIGVGGQLELKSYGSLGESCSPHGAVALDPVSGLLSCWWGNWRPAARSAGGFAINSIHGCKTADNMPTFNPVTGHCTCPNDYYHVLISEGMSGDSSRGITRGYLCVE